MKIIWRNAKELGNLPDSAFEIYSASDKLWMRDEERTRYNFFHMSAIKKIEISGKEVPLTENLKIQDVSEVSITLKDREA